MKGKLWGAAIIFFLFFAATTGYCGDKQSECERMFVSGVRAYGELDYNGAERTLEEAVKTCTYSNEVSQALQVSILEQLAFTKVALGKLVEAEEVFLRLLIIMPQYKLDEQRVSPKIIETFRRAKRRYRSIKPVRKKESKQTTPTHKVSEKRTVSNKPAQKEILRRFQVAVAAGGRMLFGKDMGNFGGGIDVKVDGYYSVLKWLATGVGVRYEFHPASGLLSGERLHLTAPMAFVQVQRLVAPLKVRAGVLVGVAFYGLDSVNDRIGMLYGGFGGISVPLPTAFEPGFEVEIAQVSDFEGRHSTTAAFVFRAAFCW